MSPPGSSPKYQTTILPAAITARMGSRSQLEGTQALMQDGGQDEGPRESGGVRGERHAAPGPGQWSPAATHVSSNGQAWTHVPTPAPSRPARMTVLTRRHPHVGVTPTCRRASRAQTQVCVHTRPPPSNAHGATCPEHTHRELHTQSPRPGVRTQREVLGKHGTSTAAPLTPV